MDSNAEPAIDPGHWNTCIMVLAEPAENLNSVQRQAALVFRYDGYVQNGGHSAVFDGMEISSREALPDALKAVGALQQLRILMEATLLRREADTAEAEGDEDTAFQLAEIIESLDGKYYFLRPDVPELLARYFNAHPNDFPT